MVRGLPQSLRHCLVPDHMVCSFSMTLEEVPNKAHGFQSSGVYTLCAGVGALAPSRGRPGSSPLRAARATCPQARGQGSPGPEWLCV